MPTVCITNSMKQNPSRETNSLSGTQKIPRVMWNPLLDLTLLQSSLIPKSYSVKAEFSIVTPCNVVVGKQRFMSMLHPSLG